MTDSTWFSKFFFKPDLLPFALEGKRMKYRDYYEFWVSYLIERCCNIFIWSGLPFKQKLLELYLITIGYAGLVELEDSTNVFDVVQCSMSGVTQYASEFTTAIGVTPLTSVLFHIYGNPSSIEDVERQGIIVDNNGTRTPLLPLIQYYANILSHIDLSIQKVAVKMRVDGLLKGSDSKSVEAIKDWFKGIELGDSIGILDEQTFMDLGEGIIVKPLGTNSNTELDSLLNARTKYLNSFFSDVGINSAEEKRERLITAEVSTGFNRVLFNISDMRKSREDAQKQISELFGVQVTVRLNPCLNVVSTQSQGGEFDSEE